MRQFDVVLATFAPKRTDNLVVGLSPFIGERLHFQAGYLLEEGPYAGEWAMAPFVNEWKTFPTAWVPLSDLFDIVPEPNPGPRR